MTETIEARELRQLEILKSKLADYGITDPLLPFLQELLNKKVTTLVNEYLNHLNVAEMAVVVKAESKVASNGKK